MAEAMFWLGSEGGGDRLSVARIALKLIRNNWPAEIDPVTVAARALEMIEAMEVGTWQSE
jgi:hypothetical protein